MQLNRRNFLGLTAAGTGVGTALALGVNLKRPGSTSQPKAPGIKVERPGQRPSASDHDVQQWPRYLFVDGTTSIANGFAIALALFWTARNGHAVPVPAGYEIDTDEQKLRLLGQRRFVRRFKKDFNKLIKWKRPSARKPDLWHDGEPDASHETPCMSNFFIPLPPTCGVTRHKKRLRA